LLKLYYVLLNLLINLGKFGVCFCYIMLSVVTVSKCFLSVGFGRFAEKTAVFGSV